MWKYTQLSVGSETHILDSSLLYITFHAILLHLIDDLT